MVMGDGELADEENLVNLIGLGRSPTRAPDRQRGNSPRSGEDDDDDDDEEEDEDEQSNPADPEDLREGNESNRSAAAGLMPPPVNPNRSHSILAEEDRNLL